MGGIWFFLCVFLRLLFCYYIFLFSFFCKCVFYFRFAFVSFTLSQVSHFSIFCKRPYYHLGFCLLGSSLIRMIPDAVSFGVFLYLGLVSLAGIQFIEQIKLTFVPLKYHPNRKYVRNVSTFRLSL